MFFTLPVFLVATRLLAHLLFSSLYRLWVVSDAGADALEQVRRSVLFLFLSENRSSKSMWVQVFFNLCGSTACVPGVYTAAGAPAVLQPVQAVSGV